MEEMERQLERLYDQQIEPGSLRDWNACGAKRLSEAEVIVCVCVVCSNPGIVNRHAIIPEQGDLLLSALKDKVKCTRCQCRAQSEMFVGKARR